jgi:hypothetical protein
MIERTANEISPTLLPILNPASPKPRTPSPQPAFISQQSPTWNRFRYKNIALTDASLRREQEEVSHSETILLLKNVLLPLLYQQGRAVFKIRAIRADPC